MATVMADGNLGRANAGRYKQVEHKLRGAQALVAHRDFKKMDSSSEDAWRRAGLGEVLAAMFLLELGKTGLTRSFKGLERAVRGPGGS